MESPPTSQGIVHFSNGKTFYLDFSSKNQKNLCQSLASSNIGQKNYPYLPDSPSPNKFYRQNVYSARGNSKQAKISQTERLYYQQLFFRQDVETHHNLKSSKKNSNNVSLEAQRHLVKSSKKHRIFESKNNECNGRGRSYTNLRNIRTNQLFQKINDIEKAGPEDQTTIPSKNICFSRSSLTNQTQQITYYVKKPVNGINFTGGIRNFVTLSQPLSHHQPPSNVEMPVSQKQRLNSINQVQSKHFIAKQQSKASLMPLLQFEGSLNHHELQRCLIHRKSKNITKQTQVNKHGQRQKYLHARESKPFCFEQSTLKVDCQYLKGHIQSNRDISISNIEQDNSLSRYYDNDDDFLPMLNRVSYKNVEIQSQHGQKSDQILVHNIFMDFQKSSNSPTLNKGQSQQIIYLDRTVTISQNAKNELVSKTETQYRTQPAKTESKIPIFLFLATFAMLLIQIFT